MPTYNNNTYLKIMRPLPEYVQRDIYGIPFIEQQNIDISGLNNTKWLINLKNANASDKYADKKIVHSFCYDDVLLRAYNNPIGYLKKVAPYYAVTSFEFSMHEKMDFRHILGATYDNRWIGAFMQANGKKVIATVGWVTPDTYNICFAGLRNGATFIISTLSVNNSTCMSVFMDGYYNLRDRFPDSKLICVGDRLSGMDSDICYIPYENSFGNWEKYPGFWQPKLFNWDGTIAGGVV
ncbi:MAG: DUF4417 domain-containing protein [Ruminiclostridium sp.]|nr:DUF4417 domain-containing protein [Ruminiclostridium sp.]